MGCEVGRYNKTATPEGIFILTISNSKRDAPFHRMAYYYSRVDWDGLRDHLRGVPREISLKLVLLLLLLYFLSGFRLEFISSISIRSSLTHLHGFKLLVLLPLFIEITFFLYTNKIILLNIK